MLLTQSTIPSQRTGSRELTIEDLPWGLSLAWKRYDPFDPGAASIFYMNVLKSQSTFKRRTDNAFMIAHVNALPWKPSERECHVLILCADEGAHWEAVRLLRESVYWMREMQCARWWFASDTKHNVAALCNRIGAISRAPRFLILGV
jgi:hypothetical protein